MKVCPKCNTEHNKSGTYCSRTCANSRVQTAESNAKRSSALKGKPSLRNPVKDLDKWRERVRETRLQKYMNTVFEDLGPENRRRRVFEEQEHKCNKCGIDSWLGQPIVLELEHKDGNNKNNARENLEGLCPNCHSQTTTWRGRNKR